MPTTHPRQLAFGAGVSGDIVVRGPHRLFAFAAIAHGSGDRSEIKPIWFGIGYRFHHPGPP